MIPILSAAAVVGVFAPVARSYFWGAPLTLFSWAMGLRAMFGAALVTGFASLILTMLLPAVLAGLGGGLLGLVLMLLSARRMRRARGIALLSWRLGDPTTREAAKAALVKAFDRIAHREPPSRQAGLVLLAAAPLSAIGEWDLLEENLDRIERAGLSPEVAARVIQALATCRLERGNLEATTELLEQLEDPPEALRGWLSVTRALVLAVQGGVEKADAALGNEEPADGALSAAHSVVRAHISACQGNDDEARDHLERVRANAGDQALQRALRPVGPATDLARAMLAAPSAEEPSASPA